MDTFRYEGDAPYKIVRRASDTGVGRSTSTAKFTILSRWDKSDVTDANACVSVPHTELKWKRRTVPGGPSSCSIMSHLDSPFPGSTSVLQLHLKP